MQPVKLRKLPQGEFLTFSQDTHDYDNIAQFLEENRPFEVLVSVAKKYRPFQKDIVHVGSYTGSWSINHAKQNPDLNFHMFEIQRMAHYAACGNIALHNVPNIKANLIGLSDHNTMINIPVIDYKIPASYQQYGLDVCSSDQKFVFAQCQDQIPLIQLDSLKLAPLIIKIDCLSNSHLILEGCNKTIEQFEPIVIGTQRNLVALDDYLEYKVINLGPNIGIYLPKWIKHVFNLQHMLDQSLNQAVPT